jgi:competence protein ComEC
MQLSRRQKWKEKMIGHLGLAFGSWVLVAWVEIWETGLVSIATPLLSWISIPWTALVIYPVTLLSLVLSWFGFGGVAQSILKWDCVALEFFVLKLTRWTMWPGNLWVVSRWSFVVGGVLATLILCASARFKTRLKTTLIMAGLILAWRLYFLGICEPRRQSSVPQSLARRVIQLDVGQGDAALILGDSSESSFGLSSHLSVGLIDAGSERTLPWDSWIQLLAKLGMTQVSWIGLTHLDEDHAGGLIRLAHLVPIRCVATSPAEIATSRGKRLASRLAQYGVPLEPWAWGCVPHPVLEPDIKKVRTRRNGNENMSAIWVPMRAGGFYLSAGDSNQKDELRVGRWVQSLARDHFAQLQSAFGQSTILPGPRLLKISHHGSRYSTSEEFLNTVQPTEVWISSGQGNRYGHPSVQTLDLLKNWGLKKGIKLRRTDQEGVLVWR